MTLDLCAMDIMQREVITLSPETLLADASSAMEVHRISSAPVVDGMERLIGVISKTDIIHYGVTDKSRGPQTVADCMYPAPISCAPTDDLRSVARSMRMNSIHHVIVVKDERVIGVISSLDLADPLIQALDILARPKP